MLRRPPPRLLSGARQSLVWRRHRPYTSGAMRQATLEEFARDPVGSFVAGETYVHFCATPKLWGVILWARPSERDAVQLGRSLVLELGPPAEPHASIVDARRLQGADPGAFQAAGRYLMRHRAALATWVRRLALLRPSGISGAIVAGAYDVLPRPYPVRLFTDAAAALAWLGSPAASAAMVEQLYASASRTPPVLGSLRGLLDGHLLGMAIDQAARALGVSERTLQRRLREAGTTFKDELADAKIRAAKQMLLDGASALTTVALDVGCASLQHFSALFRRRTGESPSAFRRRGTSAQIARARP
jgi:AraC-like DNA-binding protein